MAISVIGSLTSLSPVLAPIRSDYMLPHMSQLWDNWTRFTLRSSINHQCVRWAVQNYDPVDTFSCSQNRLTDSKSVVP